MRVPRRRRSTVVLLAAMLSAGTGAAGIGMAPASAGSAPGVTLSCGSVITQDTTLGNDLGPCPGDGLLIMASNITVDLGGHTITGASAVQEAGDGTTAPSEQAGVQLMGVSGVTLTNGTVQDFDAGVPSGEARPTPSRTSPQSTTSTTTCLPGLRHRATTATA